MLSKQKEDLKNDFVLRQDQGKDLEKKKLSSKEQVQELQGSNVSIKQEDSVEKDSIRSGSLKMQKIGQIGKILYLIAFIFIMLWAIGFFAYNIGSVIHILLIISSIFVLIRIIKEK